MDEIQQSSTAVIRLSYDIDASADRVWRSITEETGRWWDQDFAAVPGSGGAKLEARLGGRLYEEAPDGTGLVWATVIAIDPGRSIDFLGIMTPAFSGPTMTTVRLEVAEREGGATLTMIEGLIGRVTDAGMAQMRQGWDFLFGTKLKGYAEARG